VQPDSRRQPLVLLGTVGTVGSHRLRLDAPGAEGDGESTVSPEEERFISYRGVRVIEGWPERIAEASSSRPG
jgi:hypothetical protein